MFTQYLIFVISLGILIFAGDLLVKGASRIALQLHLSPLVVGLTIVAFGTSAPELFISVNSAVTGSPDIAMGNVIGSNICNLALVLGAASMISPMSIKSNSLIIDWPVAMGGSVLLYLFILDGLLQTLEGIAFVIGLVIYLYFIIKKSRKDTRAVKEVEKELPVGGTERKSMWKDILFIVIGCIGLYYGSDWFVATAKILASGFGVSERVIGLSVVAIGTSIPELVTAGVASIKKETDIALGNLIGSNIFNILSILGITSIIQNIMVSELIITKDILWMLAITLLILPMMITSKLIARIEGFFLLAVYVYYIFSVWV